MFDIEEELKKIPDKPGVYIMHDSSDGIIYVGKAKLLKRRVRQYFQDSANHSPKIKHMVEHISWFEYILTDSETEALVLESNLIKENRPKYNTMLTDDKSYPFIKVTVKEDFPRIVMSRDARHDSNKYFGPFTSALAVKETIEFLTRIYKVRSCRRVLPRDMGKQRPCLNYHIGRCSAPCAGVISREDYQKGIEDALKFLKGGQDLLIKDLKEKMKKASDNMEYEDAAAYRDLIVSLNHIIEGQKITGDNTQDRDIIGLAIKDSDAIVQVFFIRNGKLLGRDHFHMTVAGGDNVSDILSQFIKQYYGGTPYIPGSILVREEPDDAELIGEWLSGLKGQRVNIITPKKGDKEKLISLADENARLILEKDAQRIKLEEARTTGALKEIESLLNLYDIHRIEAYDISNTNGIESVGSMVVFIDGKPGKHDYRKFKIKTVKGPDDYKSMEEVLTRRLTKLTELADSFGKTPDLILMDGGKGQVNIALSVTEKLGLEIPVAGMVKDDNHNTRALYYNGDELKIDKHTEGFKLITRIQDEAHRFAIDYHRSLRSKAQTRSVLDDIPGIGEKRRKALLLHFKDIDAIRAASAEELAKVSGMTEKSALSVYQYFH